MFLSNTFWWMVIELRLNGHRNQKQMGRNNHLQTLFYNQFYILSNCNWFRWMVIENMSNWSKQSPPNTILQSFLYSVKLQLISMNGHRIQWKCHRIQWNCHRIQWNGHWIQINGHRNQSKLVKTITSKHYFTLTPIFCHIGKVFSKIQSPPNTISHSFLYSLKLKMGSSKPNHLQTLYHTLQNTSSQAKPRVWESVREKKGRPSFENSMNGHFSACGIRRKSLGLVVDCPRLNGLSRGLSGRVGISRL